VVCNAFYVGKTIYRWAGNAETMRVQAEKDNDKTGLAIAYILKVLTLSHITDVFGDAPYFEAGKGYTEGKFYPAYDRWSRHCRPSGRCSARSS